MNPNEARTTEEAEEAKRWVEKVAGFSPLPVGSRKLGMNPDRVWWDAVEITTHAQLRALADYMEQHSKEGR